MEKWRFWGLNIWAICSEMINKKNNMTEFTNDESMCNKKRIIGTFWCCFFRSRSNVMCWCIDLPDLLKHISCVVFSTGPQVLRFESVYLLKQNTQRQTHLWGQVDFRYLNIYIYILPQAIFRWLNHIERFLVPDKVVLNFKTSLNFGT